MKTSLKITLCGSLLALVLFAALPRKAAAQINQLQRHQVVILVAQLSTIPNVNYTAYDGIKIFSASTSATAPQFDQYPKPGMQLAEAVAQLLDQGYRIHSLDSQTAILIR